MQLNQLKQETQLSLRDCAFITLEVQKMNYLKLDNMKCTVLKYLPLKNAVTVTHELGITQMTPFDRSHMT